MDDSWGEAHKVLSDIGVPVGRPFPDRILSVRDRLCLRPAGEPDTADLVGKINEVCDREGIAEGSPVDRVTWLACRCANLTNRVENLAYDLDAERAQLAAAEKPFAAFVDDALHYLNRCRCDTITAESDGFRLTLERFKKVDL